MSIKKPTRLTFIFFLTVALFAVLIARLLYLQFLGG